MRYTGERTIWMNVHLDRKVSFKLGKTIIGHTHRREHKRRHVNSLVLVESVISGIGLHELHIVRWVAEARIKPLTWSHVGIMSLMDAESGWTLYAARLVMNRHDLQHIAVIVWPRRVNKTIND
jgi:hypothetical protein